MFWVTAIIMPTSVIMILNDKMVATPLPLFSQLLLYMLHDIQYMYGTKLIARDY